MTNPDKVFFPERGLTKLDLVSYYVDVAPLALPHLRRRPFHMKRFTNGVDRRVLPPEAGARRTTRTTSTRSSCSSRAATRPSSRSLDDAAGARLGREPRLHRAAHLALARARDRAARLPADRPRPDDRRAVAVRPRDRARRAGGDGRARAARRTRRRRARPVCTSWRRSSATCASRTCAAFAKALAEEVERRIGDQAVATTTWRVADRVGVFVDFGQNARDRTIASAYSVRPTPDARVSAPLRWDEVAAVEPAAFTIETMRERIAAVGDPMDGMWRSPPSLRPRFEALGLEPPTREPGSQGAPAS